MHEKKIAILKVIVNVLLQVDERPVCAYQCKYYNIITLCKIAATFLGT